MNAKTIKLLLLYAALLATDASTAQSQKLNHQPNTTTIMATTANKQIIRDLYEQALNKRNMALLPDLIAPEYAGFKEERGPNAFEGFVAPLIRSFPDINWHIEDLIAEGDKVSIRWRWTGTFKNQYQKFAPTNQVIHNDGLAIYQLKDGKVIAANLQTDRLGFLQGIQVLPADVNRMAANNAQVMFIDKFVIPATAKEEFMKRTDYNRKFIRSLPGFVRDEAYEGADMAGNGLLTTVAVWESREALATAKEAVQAEYKRIGFNPAEFTKQLGITLDRGVYKAVMVME
jgi:predicted ester cyclase/heme-degrading monooxygenase HmoA